MVHAAAVDRRAEFAQQGAGRRCILGPWVMKIPHTVSRF